MTTTAPPADADLQLRQLLDASAPHDAPTPAHGLAAAERARDLALALGREDEEVRARVHLCEHLHRLGRHAEAVSEGLSLRERIAVPGWEERFCTDRRELLRVMSLAAGEAGRFDLALDAAEELVRLAALLPSDTAGLVAAYALAACLERMGDSWQAVGVLERALDDAGEAARPSRERLQALNGLCAISIGMFHRQRGVDDDVSVLERARAAGLQALAMLECGEPALRLALSGNLGEVMLHLGELEAARERLVSTLSAATRGGLQAHAWRLRTSIADWQIAAGRPHAAREQALALIAEMGAAAPLHTAIRAHHAAYAASRALGDTALALAHFEIVERLERQRAVRQLRSQSGLFVTRVEAQRAQLQADAARQAAQRHEHRAARLAERAERDPLTGLGNRRHLERRFAELRDSALASGRPLAVAMIDIDHFKRINDGFGHAAGDAVLCGVTEVLRDNSRGADIAVRLGGEEFVLVLPDLPRDGALGMLERVREGVARRPWPMLGEGATVTVSIGVAHAPPYELDDLLRRADQAMYGAKRDGRNRVRLNGS
jgi:diguanylate cyclase